MNFSDLKIKFDDGVEDGHKDLVHQYISRLESQGLSVILSPEHFGHLLQIRLEHIYAISNSPRHFYREHQAKKKGGGTRKISAPLPLLLFIQRWVLKNILEPQAIHPAAKAYLKKSSIKHNARFHRGQAHLFKSDVKDFFGSISSGWVYNHFLGLGYSRAVSMLLTAICCKENCLPQGAPTSGYLSNIYMTNFDQVVFSHCLKRKFRFTRYADDISISGSEINFKELSTFIDRELRNIDLKMHTGKTRLIRSHQRQKVTGVVVNEKLGPGRDFMRKLRQEYYYISKFGVNEQARVSGWNSSTAYLNNFHGRVTHALFLTGHDEKLSEIKNAVENLLQRSEYILG
ncbi:reverse transcriptase family protein [Leisingera caerulea]|uniref:reverse transcriptase family protein n=1 Tax=Leisingera caerulea TaxID=506591 RepID=UPI000A056288|nr:reverse transcriptase family protein [Leisingera caerulea]